MPSSQGKNTIRESSVKGDAFGSAAMLLRGHRLGLYSVLQFDFHGPNPVGLHDIVQGGLRPGAQTIESDPEGVLTVVPTDERLCDDFHRAFGWSEC